MEPPIPRHLIDLDELNRILDSELTANKHSSLGKSLIVRIANRVRSECLVYQVRTDEPKEHLAGRKKPSHDRLEKLVQALGGRLLVEWSATRPRRRQSRRE